MEDSELVPKNLLHVIQIKRDFTLKRSYSSSFFIPCNIGLTMKPTKPVAVEMECTGWWRSGWDGEKSLAQARLTPAMGGAQWLHAQKAKHGERDS